MRSDGRPLTIRPRAAVTRDVARLPRDAPGRLTFRQGNHSALRVERSPPETGKGDPAKFRGEMRLPRGGRRARIVTRQAVGDRPEDCSGRGVNMIHPQSSKRRSGPPVERASFGFSTPDDLDAHSFQIGSDEYVLLSFTVATEGPRKDALHGLTPSERDIVALALQGQPNAAIASARGRSSRTIANQLATIYGKLGVRSRRELAAKCDDGRKAT